MKAIFTLSMAFLLTGCAANETLQLAANTSLNFTGKQVHVVREAPDPFLPIAPANGALGALGAVAAIAEGEAFVQEHSLEDPSHGLEDQLAEHIIAKYQLAGRGQTLDFTSSGRPGNLVSWSREKNMSGLILDVETKGWKYIYDGFNFSDYIVGYAGALQLTDLQSGEVIASHQCNKDTKTLQNGKVYSQEELVANDAALLKQLLGMLAQSCLEEFKTQVL